MHENAHWNALGDLFPYLKQDARAHLFNKP